jgi:hypothetical protein
MFIYQNISGFGRENNTGHSKSMLLLNNIETKSEMNSSPKGMDFGAIGLKHLQ